MAGEAAPGSGSGAREDPSNASSPGPAPPSEWIGERLDELALQTLETAAAAGAILYVAFTAAHPYFFDPPLVYPLFALGASTAVAFACLWWLARVDRIPAAWAPSWIGLGMGMVLVNTLTLATIRASPEMTFWFALVALACGLLFLRWKLFTTFVALDAGAWLWIAVRSPPDPGWTNFAPFVLVAGIILATLTMTSRRRIYKSLLEREYRMRSVNEQLDQARRKAERAERMQTQFLANVSHDVRTPLAAIIGEAQLIERRTTDPETSKSLETIETSARHLLRLVDDLLDISRIEAGQLSVEERAFDLEQTLRASVEMVRSRADAKDLDLDWEVDEAVPSAVRSDPDRLQQVLGNLLTNAVKFTQEGHVRLTVERAGTDPLRLRFAVEDTGPGIPEDRQDELFRPFSRVGQEALSDEEGTGLGLAICKRLVEALGGEIGLDSTPGEGSTFWFTIPATPADPEEVEPASTVRLAGREVWIVGTHGPAEDAMASWGLGTEVLASLDTVEQRLADDGRPEAIVVDLRALGVVDEVVEDRVRAWRDPAIPVVVLAPDAAALAGVDLGDGPGSVLTEPISPSGLREALLASFRGTGDVEPRVLEEGMAERHPLDVIVVEDSPVTGRVLQRVLASLGYEPDLLERGDDALEAIVDGDYDLAFVDLQLPGLDGDELARQVRDRLEGDRPRLVALTGSTDEATVEAIREAGMDVHLAKPASIDEIVDQLEATPSRS